MRNCGGELLHLRDRNMRDALQAGQGNCSQKHSAYVVPGSSARASAALDAGLLSLLDGRLQGDLGGLQVNKK